MKQFKNFYQFMNTDGGSFKQKFLRSGLWLGLGSTSIRFMELFRSIILARLLLPEVFGLMGIIHLLREGIGQLSQTSFNDAIIHRKSEIEESINTAWVLNIFRGLLLSVLLFFLAPLVASFYGEEFLDTGIKILGIVFILDGLYNTNMVLYRKNIDLRKIALLNMGTNLLQIIVVIVLAYYLRNVWALLIGTVIATITRVSLSYRMTDKRPQLSFNTKLAWELFHYGKYITGAGILVFLTTRLDDGLVGKFLGMEELGFYINAYFFANLPAIYVTAMLFQLIFPAYSHYSQDQEKLNQLYLRVFKVVSFITIPASFGILALSDEIASVLLGEIWLPMVPALKILVFFGLFRALAGCTGPLLNAMGKPRIVFWILFWKLLVIATIIYPLTIRYGITGTALAVTVPMALEQGYLWLLISRLTGIPIQTLFDKVIRPFLLAGLMYGLIMLLKTILPLVNIPLFFFYVLAGILIYGVGILIFDKELVTEIKNLKTEKQQSSGDGK
jgi:PST family polysaccharide transporter/lipopolysaccharide exporter